MQPNHAARVLELFESAKALQATALSRVASSAAEHHEELRKLISDAGFKLPGTQDRQQSPAVAVSQPEPASLVKTQPLQVDQDGSDERPSKRRVVAEQTAEPEQAKAQARKRGRPRKGEAAAGTAAKRSKSESRPSAATKPEVQLAASQHGKEDRTRSSLHGVHTQGSAAAGADAALPGAEGAEAAGQTVVELPQQVVTGTQEAPQLPADLHQQGQGLSALKHASMSFSKSRTSNQKVQEEGTTEMHASASRPSAASAAAVPPVPRKSKSMQGASPAIPLALQRASPAAAGPSAGKPPAGNGTQAAVPLQVLSPAPLQVPAAGKEQTAAIQAPVPPASTPADGPRRMLPLPTVDYAAIRQKKLAEAAAKPQPAPVAQSSQVQAAEAGALAAPDSGGFAFQQVPGHRSSTPGAVPKPAPPKRSSVKSLVKTTPQDQQQQQGQQLPQVFTARRTARPSSTPSPSESGTEDEDQEHGPEQGTGQPLTAAVHAARTSSTPAPVGSNPKAEAGRSAEAGRAAAERPPPASAAPAPLHPPSSAAAPTPGRQAAATQEGARPKGGNLVGAVRTFLPSQPPPSPHIAAGKKPVKVKALEQAQAARRAEEARAASKLKSKQGPTSAAPAPAAAEKARGAEQEAVPGPAPGVAPGSVKAQVAAMQARMQADGGEAQKRKAEPAPRKGGNNKDAGVPTLRPAGRPSDDEAEVAPGIGAPPAAAAAPQGQAQAAALPPASAAQQQGRKQEDTAAGAGDQKQAAAMVQNGDLPTGTASVSVKAESVGEVQPVMVRQGPVLLMGAAIVAPSTGAAAGNMAAAPGPSTAQAPQAGAAAAGGGGKLDAKERQRKAEQKRREEEERRRAELAAKAKVKEERARLKTAGGPPAAAAAGSSHVPPSNAPGPAAAALAGAQGGQSGASTNAAAAAGGEQAPAAPVPGAGATIKPSARLPQQQQPATSIVGTSAGPRVPVRVAPPVVKPSAAPAAGGGPSGSVQQEKDVVVVGVTHAPAASSSHPHRFEYRYEGPPSQQAVTSARTPAVTPDPSLGPKCRMAALQQYIQQAAAGKQGSAGKQGPGKPGGGQSGPGSKAAGAGPASGPSSQKPTPPQQQQPLLLPRTQEQAAAADLEELRNVQALATSPYVMKGVHRTPGDTLGKKAGGASKTPGYEISPYRPNSDDEDDMSPYPRKPIPSWAKPPALLEALRAQQAVDPDKLFGDRLRTCNLVEIFAGMPPPAAPSRPNHPKRDYNKRSSSGNWIADRITWQEEIAYKRAMHYL